jgi:hypothetical protein
MTTQTDAPTELCSTCQGSGKVAGTGAWSGQQLRCKTCRGKRVQPKHRPPRDYTGVLADTPRAGSSDPVDDWQDPLVALRKLGLRLKEWRTRRGDDADTERAQIAEEIREAYAEARDLGVYVGEMTEALGVSRQRLYQILGNVQQVRTPPRRDMLLVALTESQRAALLRVAAKSDDPKLTGAVAALQHGRAVTKRTARQAVGQ